MVKLAVDDMKFEGVCDAKYSQFWTLRKDGDAQPEINREEALEMEWKKQLASYSSAEGWSRLDFVDLEIGVCENLTDDALGAILACIDAKCKLKQLTLTNCFGIVGQGLQPLRGSEVLEKLDLDSNYRFIDLATKAFGSRLSAAVVVDILVSVLEADDNCFQRLQVPQEWLTISNDEDRAGPDPYQWSGYYKRGSCDSAIQVLNARFGGIFHPKTLSTYFGFSDVQDLLKNYFRLEHRDPLDDCAFCGSYDQCYACDSCGSVGCSGWGCGDAPLQCQSCHNVNCCDRCVWQVNNPVTQCGRENCYYEETCRECRVRAVADETLLTSCRECWDLALDGLVPAFRSQQDQIFQQQSIIDQLRLENQQLRSGG